MTLLTGQLTMKIAAVSHRETTQLFVYSRVDWLLRVFNATRPGSSFCCPLTPFSGCSLYAELSLAALTLLY